MTPRLTSPELAAIAEGIDAAQWADCVRAAPPQLREELGVALLHSADFVAGCIARYDVLALNRVVGMGVARAVEPDEIDALVAAYHAAGVARMMVQVSPAAEALPALLTGRGFVRHNAWVKLIRPVDAPIPEVQTDLVIRPLPREQVGRFGEIVAQSFSWPEPLARWVAAVPGHRDWEFLGAFDEDRLLATGGLFVRGETAWLGFAATSPEARRRGGHGALIARRLERTLDLGCEWAVLETAEDLPERRSPSFHNVRRFGFEVAYLRPNYVLTLHG